jgi:hypothetical protein
MPFESGHMKRGGRKPGTPNRATGEIRELARRLLGDAQYQQNLQDRLIRGEAPRMEIYLWEQAYGKPRGEPEPAPEGASAKGDLLEILEKLAEAKSVDSSPPPSGPQDIDRRDTEYEDLT